MEKLCALKDVVPGSVIEMPEMFGKGPAIVLGLEYQTDKENLATEVARTWGSSLINTSMPIWNREYQVKVLDNEVMQQQAHAEYLKDLKLPCFGMSLGTDPEIFVEHGDGSIFPAWEFLCNEAEAQTRADNWMITPLPGLDLSGAFYGVADNNLCPKGGRIKTYWDGVQAEFAPWAKNCVETLHSGTREGLRVILNAARTKDKDARLTLRNTIELPETLLKTAANEHIQFRCSSSFNLYDDPGDGIPNAREYKWRASGGHVHFGFTRGFTAPTIKQIVRGLDGILGVVGVGLAAGIDNPERRRTYGRAGEFRLPAHGIEYRVLSNFWLCHPAIAHLVFDLGRSVVRYAHSGLYNIGWLTSEDETRAVINNCNVRGAQAIVNRNMPILRAMLHRTWIKHIPAVRIKMVDVALNAILNGVGAVVPNPHDIEKNWKLDAPQLWKDHCRGQNDSWYSLSTGLAA